MAEVQAFEARTLLTGTVTVLFASNVVTVTGDSKGNVVTINFSESGLEVTGTEDTKVRFGATVNDPDTAVALPNPTGPVGFVVKLFGGNDQLAVNVAGGLGTRALTRIDLDTGDDNDIVNVTVGSETTVNLSDVITIATGEGDDAVQIDIGGTVTVGKALTINSGADLDSIQIAVSGVLTARAAATLTTGDGEDSVGLMGDGTVTFENSLTVNTGEDGDMVNFGLSRGLIVRMAASIVTLDGNDVVTISNPASTLDFQKGLSIDSGSGNDIVAISGEQGTLRVSGGDLRITTGSGDDSVLIGTNAEEIEAGERLTLSGGLSVTTGDGADDVTILTGTGVTAVITAPIASVIGGVVTIDTGDDQDDVLLQIGVDTSLTVNGAATIRAGLGNDEVRVSHADTAVSFTKGLTIDTGATTSTASGRDTVELSGGRLSVTGLLRIATGALSDNIIIDDTLVVTGDLNLDSGSGNDDIDIDLGAGLGTPGTAAVNQLGSLTINSGSGSDIVFVNNREGGTTQVTGIAKVTTGNGNDIVKLFADANWTVVKDLSFDTGLGDDSVLVEAGFGSIRVNGNEIVSLGDDDDCFVQGTTSAINSFASGSGDPSADVTFQVDVNLTITAGTGDDVIGIAGVKVGRNAVTGAPPASVTSVDLGAGNDKLGASEVTLRDVRIVAGEGDDIVAFDGGLNGSTIGGTVNVDLGGGNDFVSSTGAIDFNGNVTLMGGAGDDQFYIGSEVTRTFGRRVALNGGTGIDEADDDSLNLDNPFIPAPVGMENLFASIDPTPMLDAVTAAVRDCLLLFESPVE